MSDVDDVCYTNYCSQFILNLASYCSRKKTCFFFSNQSSSGESEKLSTQLEYSVYVLHHGEFYLHVLGQLNVNIALAGYFGGFQMTWSQVVSRLLAFDSGLSGLGVLPGQGHYVVFLGKSSLRAVSCMYFQM